MEVLVHSPPSSDHFDFNGARINSPYLSAPSSPKRFGDYNYLSAPTSPSRFYTEFDDYFSASPSALHDWEHKSNNNNDDGFAFFVTGESETPSRSAAELFDGGKIKPLKQDQLFESAKSPLLSPTRSKISQGKKSILEAFSPRKKKESREREALGGGERRGRDRTPVAEISSSNSGRRVTRSHSPYRISHWDEESNQRQRSNKEESVHKLSSADSSTSSKSSRKWRLRDFLLFRSASEGRGTNPFRKYPVLYKKAEEVVKASPIRSRRKEPVSAHELHYARKKAETEDLKKKTFLPYKQGILGRLAGFK